jgi:hypothetical protein
MNGQIQQPQPILFIIDDMPNRRYTLVNRIANSIVNAGLNWKIHTLIVAPTTNQINKEKISWNVINEQGNLVCMEPKVFAYMGNPEGDYSNALILADQIEAHIANITQLGDNITQHALMLDLMLVGNGGIIDENRIRQSNEVLSHRLYNAYQDQERCLLYSIMQDESTSIADFKRWKSIRNINSASFITIVDEKTFDVPNILQKLTGLMK